MCRCDVVTWLRGAPLIEAMGAALQGHLSVSMDPDIMSGVPCITGTRIPVPMVIGCVVRGGIDYAASIYPDRVTRADVLDALAFAAEVIAYTRSGDSEAANVAD